MENKLIKFVNCKNFISHDYFGLIREGKEGQCKACECTYVERSFCNSGKCEIKESVEN